MRLEQRTATALALLLLVALMPNTPASFPETPASRTFATSSDGSLAGWLAAGDGQSSERIHDMVALEDGHMLMVGSFEQDINFHGDVEGFSTNDTELGAFGEDMFVAWVAENGTWTRSLSVSSGYFDGLHEVERLTDGTLVVAGRFCDLSFGESCNLTLDGWGSINKTDDNDPSALMIAAMSPDGTWLWARAFSNAFDMTVLDVEATSSNTVHIAVSHRGELLFNNETSPASSEIETVALLGMDHNGEDLFLHTVTSSNSLEYGGVLCEDRLGRTYFGTPFLGVILFDDNNEHTSQGDGDSVMAQYDEDGWAWSTTVSGQGDQSVTDCEASHDDGVTVVGDYQQRANFSGTVIPEATWVDIFEATLSSGGAWTSAMGYGGNGAEHAVGVHVTPQGETMVLGRTSSALTLGTTTLMDLDGINDGSHYDIFLAQHRPNGVWDWAVQGGGAGNDVPLGLAVSASGSPVVSFIANDDGDYGIHAFEQRYAYDFGVWMYVTDIDADGVLDGEDNCPNIGNPDQLNRDGDAFGDACDDDDDNDLLPDDLDACPRGNVGWDSRLVSNDHDGDGCIDDNEDFDDDEDGIFDVNDLCPKGPVGWVSTPENDVESDGCSDTDIDEDGFIDQQDNCPNVNNPTQADLDGDGNGDPCDADMDGDGVNNLGDRCPYDANLWSSNPTIDYDGDGCLDDGGDNDDDGDGVDDDDDRCPYGARNWEDNASEVDNDGDGCADGLEDDDDDNDGLLDPVDGCPRGMVGPAAAGQDRDGDGCIDAVEDDDDDGDGVLDPVDACPLTALGAEVSSTGCSQVQLDDDNDGVSNAADFCLNSPEGAVVDVRGCTQTLSVEGQSDDGGLGIAGWLFVLAGAVLAVALINSQRRPGPPLPRPTPPPRPVGLDDATVESE